MGSLEQTSAIDFGAAVYLDVPLIANYREVFKSPNKRITMSEVFGEWTMRYTLRTVSAQTITLEAVKMSVLPSYAGQ